MDTKDFTLEKSSVVGLKIVTLSTEPAEVVFVEPGKKFLVPMSISGETHMVYEGSKPRVSKNDDGQGNLILTMPENTVLVADFASESRGRIRRRKKIFTSVN